LFTLKSKYTPTSLPAEITKEENGEVYGGPLVPSENNFYLVRTSY